jgi:hypothetical protein
MSNNDIEKIIIKLQPYYDKLNSRYSKSYLSGSIWYVGDDLLKWWSECNTVRYYNENLRILKNICEILLMDNEGL